MLARAFCWLFSLPLVLLAACSVRYTNTGLGREQDVFRTTWPKPAIGQYLCLSVDPGIPVYRQTWGSLLGYTRDVVALYGPQEGNLIMIMWYDGELAWIDGRNVRPYRGPRPDSMCIIPGRDRYQRPIFVIR